MKVSPDDFKLDRSSFSVEDTIGYITPDVGNRESDSYTLVICSVLGQYAFSQRLSDGIVINPQVPLTLRIEQQQLIQTMSKDTFSLQLISGNIRLRMELSTFNTLRRHRLMSLLSPSLLLACQMVRLMELNQ